MSGTVVLTQRAVRLIGVASGLGVPPDDAAASVGAADALRHTDLCGAVRRNGVGCAWDATVALPATIVERSAALAWLCRQTTEQVVSATTEGALPLVLGGDHGMAVGTWRGVAQAQGAPLGMLWIDAHLDAHTSDSSLSGNAHGMPLAALLGAMPTPWPVASACLDATRVCMLGMRSCEDAELRLLQRFGVKVIGDDEIQLRGLPQALADALAYVGRGGGAFGVSIDLDVIDPHDAPGVNTPCSGGLQGAALVAELRGLGRHPQLAGLEIAEYNPEHDRDGRTAALVAALVESLLAPDAAACQTLEARHGAHNYAPLPVVLARLTALRHRSPSNSPSSMTALIGSLQR